jgi:DNA-binding SARP family transcriptional activator/TolB-like protein
VNRDRLVGLLWPETPEKRARHLLAESIYVLRRELSRELIRTENGLVAIAGGMISVDVVLFEKALAVGDLATAVKEYSGDFLEGLFVPGTVELDHWIEQERRRLRALYVGAVAERGRRSAEEGGAWGAGSADAPLDAGSATGVRDELCGHDDVPQVSSGRRRTVRSRLLASAGLPLLLLAVGVAWYNAVPAPAESTDQVAVLPFEVRGGDDIAHLRAAMVELISVNIGDMGGPRPVDPGRALRVAEAGAASSVSAARLGARYYVTGEIIGSGSRLRLTARLHDREATGATPKAVWVDGSIDELFAMTDQLSAALLMNGDRSSRARLAEAASASTESAKAMRSFLRGERLIREGDAAGAVAAFESAIAEDSAFALAYFRLASAAEAGHRPDLARSAMDAAFRHRSALPARHRLLVEASHAWRVGDAAAAELTYRGMVARYPDELEAWIQLGEVLYHGNPLRGRSAVESAPAWRRVLQMDPRNVAALHHLLRVEAHRGDATEVRRYLDLIQSLDPASEQAREARMLAALVAGNRGERSASLAELRDASAGSIHYLAWLTAGFLESPEPAAEIASILIGRDRDPGTRAAGHLQLAQIEAMRGRWDAADRYLAAAASLTPIEALQTRAFIAALPLNPITTAELEGIQSELRRWRRASHPTISSNLFQTVESGMATEIRYYLLGRLEVRLDRPTAALAWVDSIDALPRRAVETVARGRLAAGLRAAAFEAQGDHDAALAALPSSDTIVAYQAASRSPFLSGVDERYRRAEALRATGRLEESLGWYGSIAQGSSSDFLYTRVAHLRMSGIYRELGDGRQAAEHEATFRRLR